MLVMMKMNMDLKEYLQRNRDQLSWKKKIRIALEIIDALHYIHEEKAIHRDLHSGNVLYSQFEDYWYISDLGFCGPADKSSKSIYGNLPYIDPNVIITKEYTFASDIYSIAMLMWEISSCQPPFINRKHDYDLISNILNGLRPKIVPGTPLEYSDLITQCWDPDPSKRPDVYTLRHKIIEINTSYQDMADEPFHSSYSDLKMNKYSSLEINFTGSKLITYKFNNLPKNTTGIIYLIICNHLFTYFKTLKSFLLI
jgi:serine/threonine protein kinase